MPIQSVNDFAVCQRQRLRFRQCQRTVRPFGAAHRHSGCAIPSNIQGLPTWYEVRISEAGYHGARGGTDFMVAMNPHTWDKDV
jgi:hypothetical protein